MPNKGESKAALEIRYDLLTCYTSKDGLDCTRELREMHKSGRMSGRFLRNSAVSPCRMLTVTCYFQAGPPSSEYPRMFGQDKWQR